MLERTAKEEEESKNDLEHFSDDEMEKLWVSLCLRSEADSNVETRRSTLLKVLNHRSDKLSNILSQISLGITKARGLNHEQEVDDVLSQGASAALDVFLRPHHTGPLFCRTKIYLRAPLMYLYNGYCLSPLRSIQRCCGNCHWHSLDSGQTSLRLRVDGVTKMTSWC